MYISFGVGPTGAQFQINKSASNKEQDQSS